MKDNVTYTVEEQRFVKSLPPETQKIVHETKKDYPGWTAVPDSKSEADGVFVGTNREAHQVMGFFEQRHCV